MASYLAGFKFADGTFFNAELFKDEYDRLRGPLRMTMSLTIAHEKAQELNLNLTDTTLTQYKLGGYPEAVDLGQLYMIHEEPCGTSNAVLQDSVVEPEALSAQDASKDNQHSEKSCVVDCGPPQKQIASTPPQAEEHKTSRLKRKWEEPPVWFKEFADVQNRHLMQMREQHEKSIDLMKERNEILKQLIEAISKK